MLANTFQTLLSSNDDELKTRVKTVHASNIARTANAKILTHSNIDAEEIEEEYFPESDEDENKDEEEQTQVNQYGRPRRDLYRAK